MFCLLFNFYPRSPCGERPPSITPTASRRYFYPRSPCGERPPLANRTKTVTTFLSTLSLRRATFSQKRHPLTLPISIHALLAESDEVLNLDRWLAGLFLSTLSLRRATDGLLFFDSQRRISIHALLAESDALSQSTAKSTPEISIHALLAESDRFQPLQM